MESERESSDLRQRLRLDRLDSFDEELELELDDRRFDEIANASVSTRTVEESDRRHRYFRELLRLQGELVKLQDWVATTGHRVVILF